MSETQEEIKSCAECRFCNGGEDYPASVAMCVRSRAFMIMRDPKTVFCAYFERVQPTTQPTVR
jgi:hypothetical protein